MNKRILALCLCLSLGVAAEQGPVRMEVGAGYLNSTFSGKQSSTNEKLPNIDTKGKGAGFDMYIAVNAYDENERYGLSFGLGFEFANGKWDTPLQECAFEYGRENIYVTDLKDPSAKIENAKNEQLIKDYYSDLNKDKNKTPYDKTNTDGYVNRWVNKVKDGEEVKEVEEILWQYKDDKKEDVIQAESTKENEVVKGYVEHFLYNGEKTVGLNRVLCNPVSKVSTKGMYVFAGAFVNVLKFEYFAVRVFGNVGLGFDVMKDKFTKTSYFYNDGYTNGFRGYKTAGANLTAESTFAFYIPATAGLRFIIANHHGIELIGKYNLYKSKWRSTQRLVVETQDDSYYLDPIIGDIDTKITKDYAWGIRYVYEF